MKKELLLAQRNFVRAVVLDPDANSTFKVKEQINGAGSNSRIVAATALKEPGSAVAVSRTSSPTESLVSWGGNENS